MKKFELDSQKLRLVLLAGIGACALIFIAVLLLGMSVLSSKSQKLVQLKSRSQAADSQLSNLEQSKKDVEKYAYFKDVAKTVIPSDKDQAADVLEIDQMASDAGISIQSITFPASTLGLTTSASGVATDASSASSQKAISQAKPVTGIAGLYSLELTITPDTGLTVPADKQVTYAKIIDFLNRVENNRHTAQITAFNVEPASGTQGISFTLTINIFIKP